MKKLLFTVLMISALSASAQSRTNRENAKLLSETETLTNITGWYQDSSTGNWREGANYINRADYYGPDMSSNIQSLVFKKYKNSLDTVFVLKNHFKSGHYKYKSIKKGWIPYDKASFVIFDNNSFEQISSNLMMKSDKIFTTSSGKNFELWGSKINEEMEKGGITETLAKEDIYPSLKGLVYQYQNVDGLEIVRFRVPGYLSKPSKYSTPEKLDNSYFEVSLEDFLKLSLFDSKE